MMQLVKYDAMCRAIDEAHKVDEVKEIRDKALAFQTYAQQARNTDAERRASEIRIRAERKCGRLLKMMEMKTGPKAKQDTELVTGGDQFKTLDDMGISKNQSSKWQKLDDIPEEEFEAALAGPDKPSTTGLIKEKQKPMDRDALWLWGRLREFDKLIQRRNFDDILNESTPAMQDEVIRILNQLTEWSGNNETRM